MKARCAPGGSPDYAGRGITVCERWRTSFAAFLGDMGPRPTPQHSIDRIDNDGNYEPGNCRWATRSQQMRNTRCTRRITFNGETLGVRDWAERIGISTPGLFYRLEYWPVDVALTAPPGALRGKPAPFRQ